VEGSRIKQLLSRASSGTVAVSGAGKTGASVARLLTRAGFSVMVIDENRLSEENEKRFSELGVTLLSEWSDEVALPENLVLAVMSPGIPPDGPLYAALGRHQVPRVSEIDLAVAYLGMPEVAVTGTNGKTTVVELIQQMLEQSGKHAVAVGNVGTPLCDYIPAENLRSDGQIERPLLVTEVSSYQLETAVDFAPHIGVFLNLGEDHLERHESMSSYARIKSRVVSGQSRADWSVINVDDDWAKAVLNAARGRLCRVTAEVDAQEGGVPDSAYLNRPRMEILHVLEGEAERYSLAKFSLVGVHNQLNAAIAVAAARRAGASQGGIQQALDSFVAPEHRLEVVEYAPAGVRAINDSKATNPAATVAALRSLRPSLSDAMFVLLIGGQLKRGNWRELVAEACSCVRSVILFGAARTQIGGFFSQAKQAPPLLEVESLAEAVEHAYVIAQPGDTVLLSPGCASFDAYSNFEERGQHFKELLSGRVKSAA